MINLEPFADEIDAHEAFPLMRRERRPLWQWVVLAGLLYVCLEAVRVVCS